MRCFRYPAGVHLGRKDNQTRKKVQSTCDHIYRRTGLCEFIHPQNISSIETSFGCRKCDFQDVWQVISIYQFTNKNTLCVNSNLECTYSALTRSIYLYVAAMEKSLLSKGSRGLLRSSLGSFLFVEREVDFPPPLKPLLLSPFAVFFIQIPIPTTAAPRHKNPEWQHLGNEKSYWRLGDPLVTKFLCGSEGRTWGGGPGGPFIDFQLLP